MLLGLFGPDGLFLKAPQEVALVLCAGCGLQSETTLTWSQGHPELLSSLNYGELDQAEAESGVQALLRGWWLARELICAEPWVYLAVR